MNDDKDYRDIKNWDDAEKQEAKDDLFSVFEKSPQEVTGLLKVMDAGQIDGGFYSGPCSCLKGTLFRLGGAKDPLWKDTFGLEPRWLASGNEETSKAIKEKYGVADYTKSPAERWFLEIKQGDTPGTDPFLFQAKQWTLEWLESKGMLK